MAHETRRGLCECPCTCEHRGACVDCRRSGRTPRQADTPTSRAGESLLDHVLSIEVRAPVADAPAPFSGGGGDFGGAGASGDYSDSGDSGSSD